MTHLKIVLRTTKLTLKIQRPFFLSLFSVTLLLLCGTFSWHYVTNAPVIKFVFGKMTVCTSLISSIDLLNAPPTLRTPSVSRKGSSLKRMVDQCIIMFDFNEEISWLNECCCNTLNIIFWAFSNSFMFISVVISEGIGLFIFFIHLFAVISTIAIIFLILI